MSKFDTHHSYDACTVLADEETMITKGNNWDKNEQWGTTTTAPSASYLIGMWFFLIGSCCWTVDVLCGEVMDYLQLTAAVCFDLGSILFVIEAHGMS